jgi:hypothetical protein
LPDPSARLGQLEAANSLSLEKRHNETRFYDSLEDEQHQGFRCYFRDHSVLRALPKYLGVWSFAQVAGCASFHGEVIFVVSLNYWSHESSPIGRNPSNSVMWIHEIR